MKKLTIEFTREEAMYLLGYFTARAMEGYRFDEFEQGIIKKLADKCNVEFVFENGKILQARYKGNLFYCTTPQE
ncbi:hypothetical protein [Caldicellulosiruptor bescii]|uniref:Uncharacterized protein n=2 Tax=Caldicellulosiruptor bescii TaxID=31899 RepID=B9MSB1_CALBD|nr:hypothetical protein [Caldicellulosiruptor bescii]ACM61830.1 conserved hypothetical protein [Caldicellulosiruptor bescii DSM 6725]PBC87122.1 hypothetical protein B0S87_2876 [Caldicellulosiruptor bescii]PBD02487.1 hypothetical protein B0S85_2835 [Caldicellulosiruptor bescii]PFH12785.1 hypothetical protein B0S88_2875 [Caldicellulosiruptor bescii]SKC67526.1 hypothetical protein SAMN05216292_2901 [Caldicellulosiruptor bescii]